MDTNREIRMEKRDGFLIIRRSTIAQQHIYEMAGLVLNRNFVHQRKLGAKKKHRFSKAATS